MQDFLFIVVAPRCRFYHYFVSLFIVHIVYLMTNFLTMTNLYLLGALGTNEIIIIMVIVLLLFGGRKIPELMRGLGRGVREFNDAKDNVKREIEEHANNVTSEPKRETQV